MEENRACEMTNRSAALLTLGEILEFEIIAQGENAHMMCSSIGYLIADNAQRLMDHIEEAYDVLHDSSGDEKEASDSEGNKETVEILWKTPEGIIDSAKDSLEVVKARGGVCHPDDYDSTVEELERVVNKYRELYMNSRNIYEELMSFKKRARDLESSQPAVEGTKATESV